MRISHGIAVATVLLLAAPRSASAQAPSDAPGAEALFQLGRKAMNEGRLDEACERFRESVRLDGASGALLNLGVCEERRGHLAAAWEALQEGLTKLPQDDPRIAATREKLTAIDRQLPRLTVRLMGGAPLGTRVFRDDIELRRPSLGLPMPVDPGKHRVRVEAPGFATSEVELDLAQGEQRQLWARLGAVLPGAEPSPGASHSAETGADGARASGLKPSATISLITAGALAAAGATFGALTIAASNRIHDECRGDVCSPDGLGAVSDARRWGAVSTVTFVGAGCALVLGLVLQLMTPQRSAMAARSHP